MLTLTSEKHGPLIPGNSFGGGDLLVDLLDRPGFQAEMITIRLKYDDRVIFGDIPWPYSIIFVFGYSVILYLSKTLKKEIHDRGSHLFHNTSGSYQIRFQKDRPYFIISIHYAADFVSENLEVAAQPIRTQWELQSPVFYYNRPRITKRATLEQLSMLMLRDHQMLNERFVMDELARAILMDFLQDDESVFQPIYIGAAQFETFYGERDRLAAIALKKGSVSKLLDIAGIQHIPLFRKRLRQLYDLNIRDFITELRMAAAINYLKDPTRSIKEIANSTGFSSAFYFSRVFGNYFGQPPKKFQSKNNL